MNYCLRRTVKGILLSILIVQALSIPAYADGPNSGAFFQEWSEQSQIALVSSSMIMAMVIASQTDKKQYECLNEWYSKTQDLSERRNKEIVDLALKNPGALPQIVIMAAIEKKCGKFAAP